MNRTLEVCLAALAFAIAASAADSSPLAGTWEGQLEGLKAVTLEIHDSGGSLAGTATFYVIKDEGEGKRIGGETRVAMEHVQVHDGMLEFEATVPGGDVASFQMTPNGRDTAELKRAAKPDTPELTVTLRRPDIFGVWRGRAAGLPAVTMRITNEGGTLAGAILFYLIRREAGKEPTSSPGIPEPLLNPRIEGNTLDFKVSHRLAHPPGTLSDPPVSFRLKLVGPNKAELTRGDGSNGTEMLRDIGALALQHPI